MINYEEDLLKIFEEDNDQILNNPTRPTTLSKDQKLLDTFNEVNEFIKRLVPMIKKVSDAIPLR